MSLTYKGKPLRKILLVQNQPKRECLYLVETEDISIVVPMSAIGADNGVGEIIRVAAATRGNLIREVA